MKILLSTPCLTRVNGTYYRAYYLGRELAKRSHDVTLASISTTSRFRVVEGSDTGMKLVEFPNFMHRLIFHHGNGLLDIMGRVRLILKENYDVVHGFEYYANVMVPILLTRRFKKYIYVSDWSDWFSKGMAMKGRRFAWFKPAIKAVARFEEGARLRAHGVTVISEKLEQAVGLLGISEDRILRLPGGAPTDLIRPLPKRDARQSLGYPADAKVALFLGNLQGDLEVFIRAFAMVVAKDSNSILIIVGPWFPEVAALLEELGLSRNVIRTGRVNPTDLGQYLACADVFLLPMMDNEDNRSRRPNKIGDYIAAGRPIIASRVGEIVPVIERHKIGYLVNNDTQEIAESILRLFQNPEVAEEMGREARALAETQYSWTGLAARLESFYRSFQVEERKERGVVASG